MLQVLAIMEKKKRSKEGKHCPSNLLWHVGLSFSSPFDLLELVP